MAATIQHVSTLSFSINISDPTTIHDQVCACQTMVDYVLCHSCLVSPSHVLEPLQHTHTCRNAGVSPLGLHWCTYGCKVDAFTLRMHVDGVHRTFDVARCGLCFPHKYWSHSSTLWVGCTSSDQSNVSDKARAQIPS